MTSRPAAGKLQLASRDQPIPEAQEGVNPINSLFRQARHRLASPHRQNAHMSVPELATAVNAWLHQHQILDTDVDDDYVRKLDSGRHRWPRDPRRRRAFRAVLQAATDAEIGFYPHRRSRGDVPSSPHALPGDPAVIGEALEPVDDHILEVEPPSAILDRIRRYGGSEVTDALVSGLEVFVADIEGRYEQEGPAVLAPEVVRQRRNVEPLLHGWVKPDLRRRLVLVAGQMSGQLAYMSVNLGRFRSAAAYAIEAFELADYVDDDDLRAWVRGTQSLAAFYGKDYRSALHFAEDGRRYARRGRQALRLAINGQARALGQLGDHRGVDRIVGEAYELLAAFPPEHGMTPCIAFGLYSEARVASNAATAYLPLGATKTVIEHAERANRIVERSNSAWSRALIRLDMATALVTAKKPDLERAGALVHEAIASVGGNRIESIVQRTQTVIASWAVHQPHPALDAATDEAVEWLRKGASADAGF